MAETMAFCGMGNREPRTEKLTVIAETPNVAQVSVEGGSAGTNVVHDWIVDKQVKLTATLKSDYTDSSYSYVGSGSAASPVAGAYQCKYVHTYTFNKWTGSGMADSAANPYVFEMPGDPVTLTAKGKETTTETAKTYYRSVTTSKDSNIDSATIDGNAVTSKVALAGTSMTVSATAKATATATAYTYSATGTTTAPSSNTAGDTRYYLDTNYSFSKWQDGDGNDVSTSAAYTFTVPNKNLTLKAIGASSTSTRGIQYSDGGSGWYNTASEANLAAIKNKSALTESEFVTLLSNSYYNDAMIGKTVTLTTGTWRIVLRSGNSYTLQATFNVGNKTWSNANSYAQSYTPTTGALKNRTISNKRLLSFSEENSVNINYRKLGFVYWTSTSDDSSYASCVGTGGSIVAGGGIKKTYSLGCVPAFTVS